MEKRKRIETRLPEAMIQLIQSFLSEEEAARTTLISKSWYNAWLTRPVLVLRNLGPRSSATMRRYQESNLKIESFRLKLKGCISRGKPLAHSLIMDAMKLGATDLNLEFKPTTFAPTTFVLPAEVLGSETLLRLSVSGCVIDGNVNCSMLKSLSLDSVVLKSADMLKSITSSIEELSLSNSCISDHGILLGGMNVHELHTFAHHRILLSGMHLHELHKLKRLYLETVAVDNSFFNDLESRLPCLEDMSLVSCYCTAIRVKSSSLQRISIVQRDASKLELEVPNLAVFSYSGGSVPWFISIKARDECESHISMEFDHFLTSSWYLCLHKLLTQLSPSRINLTINIGLRARSVNDTRVVGKPVAVENLRIETKYDAACFLQCLFRICRPKLVTHCLLDEICSSSLARE